MRKLTHLTVLAVTMAFGASIAHADEPPPPPEPPMIVATWVTSVATTGANLRAEVDTGNLATTYRFEYVTEAEFKANGFNDATKLPSGTEASIAAAEKPEAVVQHPGALTAATSYRFRIVAKNTEGEAIGPTRPLMTDAPPQPFSLPDGRGWEMVSPVDKNGGEIQSFGGNFGGGSIQAAAGGGAITYTSSSSFGTPIGAPGANQYMSTRGDAAWSTQNITTPGLSGTYPDTPTSGVPFQIFSTDLGGAVLSNGRRCRVSTSSDCPVENAPLAGSGAPAGFRNYYLRNAAGGFLAALSSTDLSLLKLGASKFELAFAGATPDLSHMIFSTCAALTVGATEVAGVGGECDPAKQNLYEKTGTALELVNQTPGASLAAQSRAVSTDGSRVYWTNGSNLYLREGTQVKQVDLAQGGGGTFQTASLDGSVAFFSKGGHIYRSQAGAAATDLTPGGGVLGVLGASDDGAYLYYADGAGVELWHEGTVTPVAVAADTSNYPPTTGTARVSGDGHRLVFVSSQELTIFDNRGFAEVYLYTAPEGAGQGTLLCASCTPSGERPTGGSNVPGASFNGTGLNLPHSYKPRVLSADGKHLFFDSSDQLVSQDSNGDVDTYQWEAQGAGECANPDGCVSLISNGRATNGATFLDASTDGTDAYFLTDGSLVPSDPGAADVYDARVGGGFPVPEKPIPCFGDACQPLPPEPADPTPGTQRTRASGNLPPVPPKKPLHCKKPKVKKFGKCVKPKRHTKKGGHR